MNRPRALRALFAAWMALALALAPLTAHAAVPADDRADIAAVLALNCLDLEVAADGDGAEAHHTECCGCLPCPTFGSTASAPRPDGPSAWRQVRSRPFVAAVLAGHAGHRSHARSPPDA